MWHLSERNLPKNLNRLWPIKHTRPMCYSLVSHLEVHGHFIEMLTGFFPPQHQQAASKELSGLEMPNISASSYEFQRNAILTILLFCRLQACAAAPHLVSLPCGHRPLEARKAVFCGHRWTFSCGYPQQSQLTIKDTMAGSRTSTHWAHQPSLSSHTSECLFRQLHLQAYLSPVIFLVHHGKGTFSTIIKEVLHGNSRLMHCVLNQLLHLPPQPVFSA